MKIRKEILPVLKPIGKDEEIQALAKVMRSGWWGKGPRVKEFEDKFAVMVGARYAIAVTSCSHGIDLVMKALHIKDCDVINPTISFIATAMIPLWNNCTTNIVDIDRRTLNINPDDVRKHLKKDTKCIIAVNMAGIPAPIDELRNVFDGIIIEDCAHSCYTIGAGSKGDVAIWSFQAVKTLPSGDGGMITTNDKTLYEKLSSMTWFGVASTYSRIAKEDSVTGNPGYTWDYGVDKVGYKCYMIDIIAAICLEQMKKLTNHLAWRQHIQRCYIQELKDYLEPPEWSETVQYYCARAPKKHRDNLIYYLSQKKIHTSVHFKPLHKYEVFKEYTKGHTYPVADDEWLKLISLPCHPGMSSSDIEYVVYWVKQYFKENN